MRRILFALLAVSFLATCALAAPSIPNPDFEAVQIGPPFFSLNPSDIPG